MIVDESLKDRVLQANLAGYDALGVNDYIDGAPHLKHAAVRSLYAELLIEVFNEAKRYSTEPRVLDLGAGEGSVTLPMLELGARVTAVDLSPDMLARLRLNCGAYEGKLDVRCEDVGNALARDATTYDIVTVNSFLHHVPDYLELLLRATVRLRPHGQFFAFQDPLKYSTLGIGTRLFDRLAYAAWRIGKADACGGMGRYLRRSVGYYKPDSVHDNSEYHVLRSGVDQDAITLLLDQAGFDCRIVPYFSTQSAAFQSLGTKLGLKNTFGFVARRRS